MEKAERKAVEQLYKTLVPEFIRVYDEDFGEEISKSEYKELVKPVLEYGEDWHLYKPLVERVFKYAYAKGAFRLTVRHLEYKPE